MSVIDKITGISISSEYFSGNNEFTLFPNNKDSNKKNRIALIYGRNGSGKSTIAHGFVEYVNSINPRTVDVKLITEKESIHISSNNKPNKIFVFNEEYIDNNVKIKDDGLDTIVLLGEQVGIEEKINQTKDNINEAQINYDAIKMECEKFDDIKNMNSPKYWNLKITKILRDRWAETAGIKIKKQLKSSTVNDNTIKKIADLKVSRNLEDLNKEFTEKMKIFNSTSIDSQPITEKAIELSFDDDIEAKSQRILAEIVSKPDLTERERSLLDLFGVKGLIDSKEYIGNHINEICPICLREIDDKHSDFIITEINKIISKEFENFKNKLSELIINNIEINNYSVYKLLDENLYSDLVINLDELNLLINKHNAIINQKVSTPFEIVEYEYIGLVDSYKKVNLIIDKIDKKRIEYNSAISDRDKLLRNLLNLNDYIAHIEIKDHYSNYQKTLKNKHAREKEFKDLGEQLKALNDELKGLNSKKKNFKLAADSLTEELEYIFFSNKRLEILADDESKTYRLKVNGKSVPPNKVSSGERNALALCYFFADISKNMEAKNPYSDEMLLVIDDPISSFDFENKIGILSFLKYKLKAVLAGCDNTKIIIMSHDVSVVIDLEKALEEISEYCKSVSKPAYFKLFKLYNKKISEFSYKKHNEYTELMRNIFDFSTAEEISSDINIGNQIRRVVEAFSTFSFKKGIDQISTDSEILSLLPSQKARDYFENLMYRLVLNGESHMMDTARFFPQTEFYSHLSPEEKQRTAKDILCFMYILNPQHVLSHLPNSKDQLDIWKNAII